MDTKLLNEKLKTKGYKLGCYVTSSFIRIFNKELTEQEQAELFNNILDDIGYRDIKLKNNNIIELSVVDNELDIHMKTKAEYIEDYGEEQYQEIES